VEQAGGVGQRPGGRGGSWHTGWARSGPEMEG
jgi:hypothetical protein